MVEIHSDDYHDFVIKSGKLIGEFDQMYQKSKEIPWHQDKQVDWLDIRLVTELLKEYSPFDGITEFGCGLGYFLEILKRILGKEGCKCVGYDVSPTCCKKAKEIFSDFEFRMLDLMEYERNETREEKRREEPLRYTRYSLVCFSKNGKCREEYCGYDGETRPFTYFPEFPPFG